MAPDANAFFSASLASGAILTGFCGTFLSFRIQREANYCRQPAVDVNTGKAADVYLGLSHFTSSFLLLIFATVLAIVFGFVLPLFALYGLEIPRQAVVIGIIDSLIFVCSYFVCEMTHYGILNRRLLNDASEWGKSRTLVALTIVAVVGASLAMAVYL